MDNSFLIKFKNLKLIIALLALIAIQASFISTTQASSKCIDHFKVKNCPSCHQDAHSLQTIKELLRTSERMITKRSHSILKSKPVFSNPTEVLKKLENLDAYAPGFYELIRNARPAKAEIRHYKNLLTNMLGRTPATELINYLEAFTTALNESLKLEITKSHRLILSDVFLQTKDHKISPEGHHHYNSELYISVIKSELNFGPWVLHSKNNHKITAPGQTLILSELGREENTGKYFRTPLHGTPYFSGDRLQVLIAFRLEPAR